MKSHELMTVRGKRGSAVPILIPAIAHPAMRFIGDRTVRKALAINSTFFFANSSNEFVAIKY